MKTLATLTLIGLIGLVCFIPAHLNSHVWTDDGELAHPWSPEQRRSGSDAVRIEGFGQTLGFVYGRVEAWAHYEFPVASGVHSAYINNYSGGLPGWPKKLKGLRFYVDFESRIFGRHYNDSDDWHHKGWLDSYWSNDPDDRPGYWWVDYEHLEFDLTDEEWGRYDLEAESKLTAKYDIDGDGIREVEIWKATAELIDFDHREEDLGIEDW